MTDRCNLRCIYCMPEEGVDQIGHDEIMRIEEIERIVRVLAPLGISRVRLTGGEPLVRKGCVDLVRALSAMPEIKDISLTTNGLLLPRYAGEVKEAGLNRVNISLDTLDAGCFHEVTRLGKLEDALAGIEAAFASGFEPVKINAVAVRHLNQDFYAFARMTIDRPLHVRFIEYMPVGSNQSACGGGWGKEDVISAEEIREKIDEAARAAGEPELVPANADEQPGGAGPARYWKIPGALGTVGFITALSNHFCRECNRMRLTADGKLRPCLFSDKEYDLREAVREGSDEDIVRIFQLAVANKPDAHHDRVGTERKMSQIGG